MTSPADVASAVGRRIFELAREIAFPRYPGSPGNEKAGSLLARRLAEAGLEVSREPFSYDLRPAMRAIRTVLVCGATLVLLVGALAPRSAGLSLALLALGTATAWVGVVRAPRAERLCAREGVTRTANIVGRRRCEKPRKTLILLAHYDSKSQSLSFPFRVGATLAAIVGGFALGLQLVVALVTGTAVSGVGAPAAAALGAGSLLALSTLRNGNASPGGVDNAGSVAIVLELARSLPPRIPPDVELIFLLTSAEEDHMIGATRFLDAHLHEWSGRPAEAINFDGAGAPGRPVIVESYALGRRFAPSMAGVAREVARRSKIRLRRLWMPPAMGVDAIPFHHRGVPCLTFSSGSLGRATLAVHSAGDVAEHLDAPTLGQVAGLAAEVARRVAGAVC